jgi:hypothetical protein
LPPKAAALVSMDTGAPDDRAEVASAISKARAALITNPSSASTVAEVRRHR